MNISIPELSLVLLIGPSGSGKTTFARRHFKPTEVISSDQCRAMISDDENSQEATSDAFELLGFIAAKRLAAGRLTVIDATSLRSEARKPLIELAREYHVLPVAIVFDLPEHVSQERNQQRTDRNIPPQAIHNHVRQLKRSLGGLRKEGLRHVHILRSPEEVDEVVIERQALWNNRRHHHGPFDIIGDIHGCCTELEELLERLGYTWTDLSEAAPDAGFDAGSNSRSEADSRFEADPLSGNDSPSRPPRRYRRLYRHPEGRQAIFLGDIVDRGPRILEAYELVRNMVEAGAALCVPGNHDVKLMRKLRGEKVLVRHGLEQSLAEVDAIPEEERSGFARDMITFIDGLVSHYVLDDGRLVVAHAGMKENMQGRGSGKVREFALFGETTGETDEFGLPVRYNWAAEYRGEARVVYGHTPVPEPEWLNRTINIDTGCVFGGRLTALRYPELELVSVQAAEVYAEPIRPIAPAISTLSAQQIHDDMLDIGDVLGRRHIATRLGIGVTIREENSRTALEVMSRWGIDPRWLIYLPPTMSPTVTSNNPDLLEHPAEAFDYYRKQGIARVICEEKHMGSRAVMILCRDEQVAERRFGITSGERGICYTRTGRSFFADRALERELLARVDGALEQSGLWDELNTGWIALDCELMPWSAKAQELLQTQYAAVGAAARTGLAATLASLETAASNGSPVTELLERFGSRAAMADLYIASYRRYCWPVHSVDDLKLAPFHILATEGMTHTDKPHLWHMETIARFAGDAPSLMATPFRIIDLNDPASESEGIEWWENLTAQGGEGMVVKPFDFIARGAKGIVQPAVKCRGREYLRIIYGAEYTAPEHMEQLRRRNVSMKRSLAMQEFALGIEGLERFVAQEPLRRVHECVAGVLALESEPVDPRL